MRLGLAHPGGGGAGPTEGVLEEDPLTSVPAPFFLSGLSSISQTVCWRTGVCPQPVLQRTRGSKSCLGSKGAKSSLEDISLLLGWPSLLSLLPSLAGVSGPQELICSWEGPSFTSHRVPSVLGCLPQSHQPPPLLAPPCPQEETPAESQPESFDSPFLASPLPQKAVPSSLAGSVGD